MLTIYPNFFIAEIFVIDDVFYSDIGLFTERSEITVHHTTSQALENSIKERVKRLLGTDVTDITPSLIDELDDLKPQKSQKIVEIDEKQLESHE